MFFCKVFAYKKKSVNVVPASYMAKLAGNFLPLILANLTNTSIASLLRPLIASHLGDSHTNGTTTTE